MKCWLEAAIQERHRVAVNEGLVTLKLGMDRLGIIRRGSMWRRVRASKNPRACAAALIRQRLEQRDGPNPKTVAAAVRLLAEHGLATDDVRKRLATNLRPLRTAKFLVKQAGP